ncbi:MAG: hypothetical protein QM757_17140 [Paludibaculum sp.]
MPILTILAPLLPSARIGDTGTIKVGFSGKPWKDVQGYQFVPEAETGKVRVGDSLVIEAVTPGGGLLPAGTRVRLSGRGFTPQSSVQIGSVALTQVTQRDSEELEVTLATAADLTAKRVVVRNADGAVADFYPALRGEINPGFQDLGIQPIFPSRTDSAATGWPMVQNASNEPVELTYMARIGAGVYLRYPTATGRLGPGEIAAGPPISFANSVSSSSALSLSASKPVRMMSLRVAGPEEGSPAGAMIPIAASAIAPVLRETWADGKPSCFEGPSGGDATDAACVAWLAGPTRPNPLTLNVAASASPVLVSASATTADGNPWLSVSPEHATVCGVSSECGATAFSVRMNPSMLEPGEYSGAVTVTAEGSAYPTRTVPVVLRVANSLISVNPVGSVIFSVDSEGRGATPVELKVASSGAPAKISVKVQGDAKGGDWLTVSPSEAMTPATLHGVC